MRFLMRFLKGFLTGLVAVAWIAVRVYQMEKVLRRPQPVRTANIGQAFQSVADQFQQLLKDGASMDILMGTRVAQTHLAEIDGAIREGIDLAHRGRGPCPVHGPTCIQAIRAVRTANGAH